jgi:hypothetical protein
MAIADDFTIDYVNRRVYHSSGTSVYTVNQLYSYLMDTFEEPEQMDDTVPMSAQTPTDYTLINSWFMDDESYKYLKGGAIQTIGYFNNIQVLTLSSSGYTGAIATDIGKVVTDDAANTGNLLAYNNTTRKWWIRWNATIASGSTMAITTGTGAGTTAANSASGEDLFPNVYTLGSIEEDDNQQIYIIQDGNHITEWWPDTAAAPPTRHIDVLIKTKEANVELDEGRITVFLRHYPSGATELNPADLYDHFDIDLSAGGRNAVPLATSPDLNNTSNHATVSAYNDITIAFVNGTINHGAITNGPFLEFELITGGSSLATAIVIDENAGVLTLGNIDGTFQSGETLTGSSSGATTTTSSLVTTTRTFTKAFTQGDPYNYSVIIDCANRPLAELYEYFKYVTRENSNFQTYGVTNTGGTLSINQLDGEQYIRAFIDYTTSTNTFAPVKASPFGTFAGGKFFGARGIWIENMDPADIQSFQLIDSDNVTRVPPTQVTITVSNLLAADRVAVFRTTAGTTINKAMYTLAAGNDVSETDLTMVEDIAADTPATGIIRVVDTSDNTSTRETRYSYTSWSGKTFSGIVDTSDSSPGLDRSYTATDDTAYVPFIDKIAATDTESVTVIYSTDRSILVRVRRYTASPILPFENDGTVRNTGFSISTIRTPDSIVTVI